MVESNSSLIRLSSLPTSCSYGFRYDGISGSEKDLSRGRGTMSGNGPRFPGSPSSDRLFILQAQLAKIVNGKVNSITIGYFGTDMCLFKID